MPVKTIGTRRRCTPGRGAFRSLRTLAVASTLGLCASGALLGAGTAQDAPGRETLLP
jgi:hypothetical protein